MADLDKTNIITKLENASLTNEKTTFLNKDISDLRLSKLTLDGHLFKKCNFFVSSFYGCVFTNCEFIDCNFTETNLLNVKFLDCTFVKCDFTKAKLQDVLIDGGFKSNCIFRNLEIIGNVKGISEEESNIISENDEKTMSFDDKIKAIGKSIKFKKYGKDTYIISRFIQDTGSKIELIITKEADEYGPGVWRVIASDQWGDGDDEVYTLASDTIKENWTLNRIKLYIAQVIEHADKELTESVLDEERWVLEDIKNGLDLAYTELTDADMDEDELEESVEEPADGR